MKCNKLLVITIVIGMMMVTVACGESGQPASGTVPAALHQQEVAFSRQIQAQLGDAQEQINDLQGQLSESRATNAELRGELSAVQTLDKLADRDNQTVNWLVRWRAFGWQFAIIAVVIVLAIIAAFVIMVRRINELTRELVEKTVVSKEQPKDFKFNDTDNTTS